MIHMLMRDPEEAFGAYLFRNSSDDIGEYFEFGYEGNNTRSTRVTVGKNLLTSDGSTRIRTDWDLSFFPGSYVLLLDDNSMHIIDAVDTEISSTASQALLFNKRPERDVILTLRLVRNPKGAQL